MIYTLTKQDKITLLKAIKTGVLDVDALESRPTMGVLTLEEIHFNIVDLSNDIEEMEMQLKLHKGQISEDAFWDWCCPRHNLNREVIRTMQAK